jgi:Leucine-rich repeat (LRR) protein
VRTALGEIPRTLSTLHAGAAIFRRYPSPHITFTGRRLTMAVIPSPIGARRATNRFRGFALTALVATAPVHAAIPASERQALLDLYNNTQGTSDFGTGWGYSDGWGGDPGSECTWANVSCDDAQEHVIAISLDLNNLVGTLPASLNQLTQMTSFSVVENFLSGPMPSLSGMTNLQSISVGRNQLTGNLPSLTGLTSLQSVFFGYNQFSGTIPPFAGVPNLNWFDATYNQLSGGMPSLTGLTNLQYFLVTGNQLTGSIPDLSDQTGLEIDADDNLLSGNLPSSAQLAHLSDLFVEGNRFSGRIPELAGLTGLRNFDVARNQLSEGIPALAGMISLQNIYFSDNQLSGELPALTGLAALRTFDAARNRLSGAIPSLDGLTNLFAFTVQQNQLTGHIPSLTGLSMLMILQVDHNQLSGVIPALDGLRWLGTFFVGGNKLHGPSPLLPSPTTLLPYGQGSLCPNYLDPVASADWDTITQLTPWYQDCSAQPAQDLTLSPAALSMETETAGSSASTTLTIGNAGSGDLHWNLATTDSDCAAPASVSWMAVTSASSGTTTADSSSAVTLMFDAGTLASGTYSAKLCVSSDDPAQPVVGVPVNFVVESSADAIFSDGFDGP